MSETLYTNTVALLQKSRKALRLYKSLTYQKGDRLAELKELQAAEWRDLNSELLERLSEILSSPRVSELSAALFRLKDAYHAKWRQVEAEVYRLQKDLITCSERGEFLKSAALSSDLVAYKARMQAYQAAYHELEELVSGKTQTEEKFQVENDQTKLAKVIPLRGKVAS